MMRDAPPTKPKDLRFPPTAENVLMQTTAGLPAYNASTYLHISILFLPIQNSAREQNVPTVAGAAEQCPYQTFPLPY